MRLFYDACHSAIEHARVGNHFGSLLWLQQAEKFRRQFTDVAKKRCEFQAINHLSSYFRSTREAVQFIWLGEPRRALGALLTEETTMNAAMGPPPASGKTVQRGSLATRWADEAELG